MYSITSRIGSDSYTTNNINFNPTLIRSYQGLYRHNYVEEISYKSNTISKDTKILSSFYFWIQNFQLYYERHYQKLTDVFSNIGGYASGAFMIAKIINYFISKFVILIDTEELIFNIKKDNYKYENLMRKSTIINL